MADYRMVLAFHASADEAQQALIEVAWPDGVTRPVAGEYLGFRETGRDVEEQLHARVTSVTHSLPGVADSEAGGGVVTWLHANMAEGAELLLRATAPAEVAQRLAGCALVWSVVLIDEHGRQVGEFRKP
ncbi:hypothetical protein [Streptomyces sp. cg35]|uniref:hypothetical protein n=1 Tax=Streptomyces sp. cg35 TaxID=3421650 RepID=UPI003D177F50